MKYCYKCKTNKEEESFNKDSSTKDGLANLCRFCDNVKSRQYHNSNSKGVVTRQRRIVLGRKLLLYGMFDNKCQRCGSTENLEFHHRDPKTKLFSIGTAWRKDLTELLAEVEKCDLLCFKCHRGEMKHGTISMYVGAKCRCDACVAAHKDYQREYHKKRKVKGQV